ncbi:hypothetical protein DRQ18_02820 [bacterium]|nr:MAG: hypothetical protein DRQ18_02820 [bacterium]
MFVAILLAYPVYQPIDARACGMGGAFTAIADNAFSYYWNPGAMVFGNTGCMFYYQSYMDVPNLNIAALAFLTGRRNMRFGGGWIRTGTKFESGDDYDLINEAAASDNMFSIAFAGKIGRYIGVGAVLHRYLFSTFDGSAGGIGFDLGFAYRRRPIAFGVMTRNVLSSSGDEYYPTFYRGGLAFLLLPKVKVKRVVRGDKVRVVKEFYGYRVALSFDAEWRPWAIKETEEGWKEGVLHWYTGIEYAPLDMFGLRLGYSDLEKFSFGFTFGYRNFIFDFSYNLGENENGIGRMMRTSLTMRM